MPSTADSVCKTERRKQPDNAKRRHSFRCTATLHKYFVIAPRLTYTGVEIVDAVLNVKQNEGIKNNIKTDIRASYPHNRGIVSVDICTILGNLLDNAIEACAKVEPKEKRHINVRISYTENIVMIKIENTVSENPFLRKTPLETTKKDRKSHGLGISIVKKTTEKYHGDLKQICENGVFVSKVILYSNSNAEIDGQKSAV